MSVADLPRRAARVRVRVEGTVQGVGFRPYIYRLATELGLHGHVLNDAHGVLLELEGLESALEELLARLEPEAPPLAVVERVTRERVPVRGGECGFRILPSPRDEPSDAPVTADSATCSDCLAELADPGDRRFRYPFINCTNCGPRFTIVRGVPYDRPFTTMAAFTMCAACRQEYEDPADRRFHAQPNACPDCGPAVRLCTAEGRDVSPEPGLDVMDTAARALRAGMILAVKGIGGFHLACRADPDAEPTVARLRAGKHREEKPFALMVADVAGAAALVELDTGARALLASPARPIVVAPRRSGAAVAASVAPRCSELGVMLPYSPLHHLLLAEMDGALVLTSGNRAEEPIAFRDEDALAQLGAIADLFLLHDRPIETRTDDSVMRAPADGRARAVFLRRSRGHVPASLPLGGDGATRPLLACGAELKSTFTVGKGTRAWVSHHIGDLENYETLRSFTEGIEHFCRLFDVAPELVAHDLHPEYLSTKYAQGLDGVELLGVQHHHAHLAACLAEHGETGPAVGAIFDGSGHGGDGTVWGGELLLGDLRSFERVGALEAVRLPGGAAAIREPWRMAAAWLHAAGELADGELGDGAHGAWSDGVRPELARAVSRMLETGTASPWTTSVGRLFDAVAALGGLRRRVSYEGQAAIELEAACDPLERGCYPFEIARRDGLLRLDPREMIRAVRADARAGVGSGRIAARFHRGLADATVRACVQAAGEHGTELVVLGGGVFANARLLDAVAAGLGAAGLRVLVPERLPPGDGGISYGQAAIAASRS